MSGRCVAPLEFLSPDGKEVFCERPATTERIVEELVCGLCEEHAAELDADRSREGRETN